MLPTDVPPPQLISRLYHRTNWSLLAPFHPCEFQVDNNHYLAFIARFGIYLSSSLGITNDFSPFQFDIFSFQIDNLQSSSSTSNLSNYYIPNPNCHLSFRGFSLHLGGDELIGFSPWRTYGEGFHVDIAPPHILRNIPNMESSIVPFSTMIPLGYDDTCYPFHDLPYRTFDIKHPHNKINVIFGNLLLITGDTIYQDTTNRGDKRGLHRTLIWFISSSQVNDHISKSNDPTPLIDPIEISPINTRNLNTPQVNDFITEFRKQLYEFALNQFQQFKSPNEWWTYFGYVKNVTQASRLEKLTESVARMTDEIKQRLIGRDNFKNGCTISEHMSQWENWLLVRRFKYEVVTFDYHLNLFTHNFIDKDNILRTKQL